MEEYGRILSFHQYKKSAVTFFVAWLDPSDSRSSKKKEYNLKYKSKKKTSKGDGDSIKLGGDQLNLTILSFASTSTSSYIQEGQKEKKFVIIAAFMSNRKQE